MSLGRYEFEQENEEDRTVRRSIFKKICPYLVMLFWVVFIGLLVFSTLDHGKMQKMVEKLQAEMKDVEKNDSIIVEKMKNFTKTTAEEEKNNIMSEVKNFTGTELENFEMRIIDAIRNLSVASDVSTFF